MFSLYRWWAIVVKEFIQMRRDRLTFGMIIGIPLIQLVLFGFAINSDPRHLPTLIHAPEPSVFSRSLVAAMRNSGYFEVIGETTSPAALRRALKLGEVQFALTIPADFSRKLVRGEHPALLLEADATDPAATSNALQTLQVLVRDSLNRDLRGPLAHLRAPPPLLDLRIHRHYNPEGITQYNIVPGLMGVVLTMTMVIITSLALTRERERGTMEYLLATPVRPLEVMVGKIMPYILVGYFQAGLILALAHYLFRVPMLGSLPLLLGCSFVFIAANLAVGILYSTLARNQLQAVQMAIFFFLPSLLLSGFMFPFRGMPGWAQALGEILPLTHFLRIVRGILLKGNGWVDTVPHLLPIALFTLAVVALGALRYRETLD